jgi:hypothetical protein
VGGRGGSGGGRGRAPPQPRSCRGHCTCLVNCWEPLVLLNTAADHGDMVTTMLSPPWVFKEVGLLY